MRSCPSGSQVVCWLVKSISFHAEVHPTLRVAPVDAHGSRSGTSYWGRPDSGARHVSKSNTCETPANLPEHSMQILHLWTNDIPHILIDFNRIIWVCLRKKNHWLIIIFLKIAMTGGSPMISPFRLTWLGFSPSSAFWSPVPFLFAPRSPAERRTTTRSPRPFQRETCRRPWPKLELLNPLHTKYHEKNEDAEFL